MTDQKLQELERRVEILEGRQEAMNRLIDRMEKQTSIIIRYYERYSS